MSFFWRMTKGKVVEGVFAVHKPKGITSAQVIRDLQRHFNPSRLFEPWVSLQKATIARESHNQRKKRKQKQIQIKIGHGGTLDPLATGVLICGVGKGTKNLQDFLLCTKSYETVVLFGASTDTQDRTGKILKRAPYQHITKEMVEKALGQFRGKIMQLPPLFSALKMNGKPLYEYAREGKPIPREIEKRQVEVVEMELVEWYEGGTHHHKLPDEEAGAAEKDVAEALWKQERLQESQTEANEDDSLALKKRKLDDDQDALVSDRPATKTKLSNDEQDSTMSGGLSTLAEPTTTDVEEKGPPAAKIRMTVTSGFYVRSLCHDLGQAVGSQANMAELVRSRQGQFELGKNVFEYDELAKGEDVWGPEVERMLDQWNDEHDTTGSRAESHSQQSPKDAAIQEEKVVEQKAETAGETIATIKEGKEEAKAEEVKGGEPEAVVVDDNSGVDGDSSKTQETAAVEVGTAPVSDDKTTV